MSPYEGTWIESLSFIPHPPTTISVKSNFKVKTSHSNEFNKFLLLLYFFCYVWKAFRRKTYTDRKISIIFRARKIFSSTELETFFSYFFVSLSANVILKMFWEVGEMNFFPMLQDGGVRWIFIFSKKIKTLRIVIFMLKIWDFITFCGWKCRWLRGENEKSWTNISTMTQYMTDSSRCH